MHLTEITQNYLRTLIGEETDADLLNIQHYAKNNNIPILLPESANLLKTIAQLKQPKKILEIGTAIGYSGQILLKSTNAHLYTIENYLPSLQLAKENFKNANLTNRVTFFVGDACQIVPLLDGKYDFIFLDSAKGSYPILLPHLLKVLDNNGVLVCDNVLFRGNVQGENHIYESTMIKRLRQFLVDIYKVKNLTTSVLPIGDGICISTYNY